MTSAPAAQPLGSAPSTDTARPLAVLQLGRAAGLLLLCALPTGGSLLVGRRWAAAAQPLDASLLPPAALALALVAWLARRLAEFSPVKRRAGARRLPLVTTSASLFVFGLALGATRSPWWSAIAYWAIVICEEGWAWSFAVVERNSFRSYLPKSFALRRAQSSQPYPLVPPSPAHRSAADDAERLTQQYTRVSLGEGQEMVRGALHITVPTGARTATAHVSFCPPFAERPRLDVRVAAGPHCRLKVGQLLPQGARIEIRLATPLAAAQRLSLEFSAQGRELVSLNAPS